MAVGGGFVAGSIISKLVLDKTGWDRSTRDVVNETGRLGQKLGQFGATLSTKVTAPLALAGAAAVKASADFEQKLVNAFSVTGSSSEAVKQQMSDLAREMGATTVFSANEAADAMYYMASAGWKADDMGAALKDTLDLAAATQTDLAFTTSTVISTLNQFRLTSEDANRVTNVYAAAISNSQATMDRLGTSMMYVGPVMNSLGKNVEESTSLLMGLYNAGFDASTAGTALRMGLVKLLSPTKQTSEALDRLGLTFKDVNPETHKIADIIQLLGDRSATTKDIMEIFGVRAGPAFAALINQGGDALKKYEAQITGTNRAAEMAEMQIDTFKGSFKLLTSALTESAISIGDMLAPAIRSIADGITGLITKFNELGPETRKFIVTLGGIAAALGPILVIGGKVLILVGKLQASFIASKAAFMISAAGVGILIGALAALVIGILKVKSAQDQMNKSMKAAHEQESKLEQKLYDAAIAAGMTNKEFLKLRDAYDGNTAAMTMAIKAGKEGKELQEALAEVSAKHKEKIDEQKGAIDANIPSVADLTLKFDALAGTEEEAKEKAESWIDFLGGLGLQTIQESENRVSTLKGHLDKLHEAFRTGRIDLKTYTQGVNAANEEIQNLSTTLVTTALPAANLTSSEIALVYSNAVSDMETRTGDFTQTVKEQAGEVIDIGKEFSETFAGSFNESLTGILEGTMSWKDGIMNILGDLKSKAIQIFVDMATGYIMNFAQKLIMGTIESTTSVASQLTSTATNLLKQVGEWSPGGIVGSVIQGAVSGIFAGIFGGGMSRASERHIQDIVDATRGTRDVLFIDILPMFWELVDRLDQIRDTTATKADGAIGRLHKIRDYTKQTAIATSTMVNQLKKLKGAQTGSVFKETELAIMHGTPSNPEIAMPMKSPMAEHFTAAKGSTNISMKTEILFDIKVKDQLDPHAAQKLTREIIIPNTLQALEVNAEQSRTKLKEILKLRI